MKLIIKLFILFSLQSNYLYSQTRDPRPKDQANVFWDGTYPLYSLVSDKQIFPRKNGVYVYYATTNEDPSPSEHTVEKGEVNYVYKFISWEECLEFCNQIRIANGMQILKDEDFGGVDNEITFEEDDEISSESEKQLNQNNNSNIKATTIASQTKKETNTLSQQRNFPTLTFPIEIISHDPKRNFFMDFTSYQDIGKNLINNPYNVGDEFIIKNVDTIVKTINKNLSLLSNDLANIRKSLPNSEKKLKELHIVCQKVKQYYENPEVYKLFRVNDRDKIIKKLKKYTFCSTYGASLNYRIFLFEIPRENSTSTYHFSVIENNSNVLVGSQPILEEDWDKLVKKDYIQSVDENLRTEFLFEIFGISETIYLGYGLFNLLKEDSLNYSKNKQDIFGYTYIGQVENGVRSGFGTLVNLFRDTIYKGIWKDDMPYQGQFYQFNYENKCFGNCENGIGLKMMNDCVYRGGFRDGKRDGKGEYIFIPNYSNSSNNYMISTFTNGKDGIDRKDYALNSLKFDNNNVVINKYYNGNIYFESKQVDEYGYHKVLWIFNHGQIYSGSVNYQNDIKKGAVYFQNGNIYLGSDLISSNNIDGEGILIKLNSNGTFNTLMGEFVDGKINGFGTVTYASGKVNDGLFENGNFIKSNAQIEEEKIAAIEKANNKENEEHLKRKKEGEEAMNGLVQLLVLVKEYEKTPEGKAWKLEKDKKKKEIESHCGICDTKLGSRKFKYCFDNNVCSGKLYVPNPGNIFYCQQGELFFCSPGHAIDYCNNLHNINR